MKSRETLLQNVDGLHSATVERINSEFDKIHLDLKYITEKAVSKGK